MSQRHPKAPRPAKFRLTATVSSVGQLTIPKYLRDKLGITPGTRLQVQPVAEERLVLTPISRPNQSPPITRRELGHATLKQLRLLLKLHESPDRAGCIVNGGLVQAFRRKGWIEPWGWVDSKRRWRLTVALSEDQLAFVREMVNLQP
jgi:AbrB family looped-hinge helix DNA binding protein